MRAEKLRDARLVCRYFYRAYNRSYSICVCEKLGALLDRQLESTVSVAARSADRHPGIE